MINVFFSYSHRDDDLRNEMEIHLSTLKRQGVIDTWHDRRIGSGKDIDAEIDTNLELADIILLLVSPYFIASDYCYNIEMKRAIERHNRGDARVIPVILHPCDWHNTPFGKLRATPSDGKPISKFPNKHDAFLEVVKDIRGVVQEIADPLPVKKVRTTEPSILKQTYIDKKPRSSNLRVTRDFSDIEKSRFLLETFEYFSNFFENSLIELKDRTTGIETEFRRIDANRFTAAIYRIGKLISQCKIWLSIDDFSSEEIRYSSSRSISDNSWNAAVSIIDDGYMLGLRPFGMYHHFSRDDDSLTQEGAAEFFWSMFIESLQ